jgi:hypothetical protein
MIATLAFFTALSLGQLTAISGPDRVDRDRLVRLDAVGAADSILWEIEPAEGADIGPDCSAAFVFVAPPGRYVVRAIGASVRDGKVELSRVRKVVTIGGTPTPPNPDPGPNPPDPGPGPGGESEAARAARRWAPMILQANAVGMEAAARRLEDGDGMGPSMAAGSQAQAAARSQAMRATVTPILEAILPEGSTVMTEDQRRRLIAAYREAAAALRASLPTGGRR